MRLFNFGNTKCKDKKLALYLLDWDMDWFDMNDPEEARLKEGFEKHLQECAPCAENAKVSKEALAAFKQFPDLLGNRNNDPNRQRGFRLRLFPSLMVTAAVIGVWLITVPVIFNRVQSEKAQLASLAVFEKPLAIEPQSKYGYNRR